jgi:hypothetical protein
VSERQEQSGGTYSRSEQPGSPRLASDHAVTQLKIRYAARRRIISIFPKWQGLFSILTMIMGVSLFRWRPESIFSQIIFYSSDVAIMVFICNALEIIGSSSHTVPSLIINRDGIQFCRFGLPWIFLPWRDVDHIAISRQRFRLLILVRLPIAHPFSVFARRAIDSEDLTFSPLGDNRIHVAYTKYNCNVGDWEYVMVNCSPRDPRSIIPQTTFIDYYFSPRLRREIHGTLRILAPRKYIFESWLTHDLSGDLCDDDR